MEKKFDVVGIGHPCVDYAMRVERLPRPDAGSRVKNVSWQGGGVVPTGLVAAARLGLKCALIGVTGDDLMGQFCYQDLKDHGIDVSQLKIRENSETDMAVVLSDDETHGRSILYHSGQTRPLTQEEIDPDVLRGARFLYLDGCSEMYVEAAKLVKAEGGKVLIDAGIRDVGIYEKLLPYVDYFIGSAFLYRDSFPDGGDYAENLQKVRDFGPETVAFTFGSEGVRALDSQGYVEVPAFKVDVVDTLGAGDVFHGAFFYGLTHDYTLRDTIRFASAVSAIKCTAPGGRAGIPTEQTVLKFLETGEIDREEIEARVVKYSKGIDRILKR